MDQADTLWTVLLDIFVDDVLYAKGRTEADRDSLLGGVIHSAVQHDYES